MENDLISRHVLKIMLEYHKKPTDQAYETERQWAVGYNAALDRALYTIAYFPDVDAVPVVHGRWEYDADGIPRCSACHSMPGLDGAEGDDLTPFCPHCGADMRGKDDAK